MRTKNLNNIVLPHPVLGHNNTVIGDVSLGPKESDGPVILTKKDEYEVTLEMIHNNAKINQLVEEGNAEYYCEIGKRLSRFGCYLLDY